MNDAEIFSVEYTFFLQYRTDNSIEKNAEIDFHSEKKILPENFLIHFLTSEQTGEPECFSWIFFSCTKHFSEDTLFFCPKKAQLCSLVKMQTFFKRSVLNFSFSVAQKNL